MSDERKPRLPPSGLADEILGQLARGELSAGDEPQDVPAPEADDLDRIITFTDRLQLGEEEEEEREVYETWVEFRLAGRYYALPVAEVREILRLGELTPVPHSPFPVLGVFNLRGRVVPLLDLRARLGLPEAPADSESRIVLVESRARRIGLLVDAATRVARLARSAIRAAGDAPAAAELRGLCETEGREIGLLDLGSVLRLPEAADAAAGGEEAPQE